MRVRTLSKGSVIAIGLGLLLFCPASYAADADDAVMEWNQRPGRE
jgi:hypothetical protein